MVEVFDEEENVEVGHGRHASRHKSFTEEMKGLLKKANTSVHRVMPHYTLVTDENAKFWSNMAVRFAVLADSVGATILQPNFPFIALPGAHEVNACRQLSLRVLLE